MDKDCAEYKRLLCKLNVLKERGFIGIIFEIIFSSDVISGVAVIIFAGVDIFIPLTYHKMIIFGAAWYSYGECARKLGIAALIMAVLIIAGLILQRKREYYEYKKEDE